MEIGVAMSSSKSKRTVTVEKSLGDNNEKTKPSVFARLGPGVQPRNSPSTFEKQEICLNFLKSGSCVYGSKCKYQHTRRDRSSDDLRSKVSRKHNEDESDSDSKMLSIRSRKDNDSKIRSTVVVSKSTEVIDDIWPETTVEEKQDQKKIYTGTTTTSSKTVPFLYEKKDKSPPPYSNKNKSKNQKTTAEDKGMTRRKSKEKKKRKKNPSESSPDQTDKKTDQKRHHAKDSVQSLSEKLSKPVKDAKRTRSPKSTVGHSPERNLEKTLRPKDQKPKSVENRLIMLAMESEPSKLDDLRASRGKKDETTLGKVREIKRERSLSPAKLKTAKRDRSASLSRQKDTRDKIGHSKTGDLEKDAAKSNTSLNFEKQKFSGNKFSEGQGHHQAKSGIGKQEKEKQKRRASSTSSVTSSSSSSSGSGTGSSSDSSSSGSSSSSSSSSDGGGASKRLIKERRGREVKPQMIKQESRPKSSLTLCRVGEKCKPSKEGDPKEKLLRTHEESKNKEQKDDRSRDKDKRHLEKTIVLESQDCSRKDITTNRSGQKEAENVRRKERITQDITNLKQNTYQTGDGEKVVRDGQERGRSATSPKLRGTDSHEISKKVTSPIVRDFEHVRAASPISSRRAQSPTESLRSHHSAKPHSPGKERERGRQSHNADQFGDDYYRNREKSDRDDRYATERYPTDRYDKQYVERIDTRGHEHVSLPSYKIHASEKYERNRENLEIDRTEDRDGRYNSRDPRYEDDRYAISPDRYRTDSRDDLHRVKPDYYSGYHDDRRNSRIEEPSIRRDERTDRHRSSASVVGYKKMESELEYETRERDKTRDQRQFDLRDRTATRDMEQLNERCRKDDAFSDDSSRRERTSRRGHWEAECETSDKGRAINLSSRNDQGRGYSDKQELSARNKRSNDEEAVHSPLSKKRREEVVLMESHHSASSSRAGYEHDIDKDRNQKNRDAIKEEEHHSGRSDLERSRGAGESDKRRSEHGMDRDRSESRHHESRERNKDHKITSVESVSRSETREAWHRDESGKRHRSPSYHNADDGWDRNKDRKRSRLEVEEKDRSIDRNLRKEDELLRHSPCPLREHSPKTLAHPYTKHERSEIDKKNIDLAFVKMPEDDLEIRATCLKSEEKRDPESMLQPIHMPDERTRRSPSRGSLSSKKSQRDRDARRDDRYYDKRGGYDHYREGHYERPPQSSERIYDREVDREWNRERTYDRVRSDDDVSKPHRSVYEHDRSDRELSKCRDFPDRGEWDDSFRRDNLNYRGLARPSNWEWERERPRTEWDNRFDRGNEPADYRARRDVLLPPPPRPRNVTDNVPSSPLAPAVEVIPPSVEHLPPLPVEHSTEMSEPRPKSKEEDIGYDDISDDELDDLIGSAEDDKEENQVGKIPVVDILDIKWESLIKDDHPKLAACGSVVKRFSAQNIFSRIGVSLEFAGEALVNRMKEVCQKKMEEDTLQFNEEAADNVETEQKTALDETVKDEIPEANSVKEELEDESEKKQKTNTAKFSSQTLHQPVKFELFDAVANFHMGLQLKARERIGLVSSIGPYRRALCARRDLAIRRALCKVEKEEIVMFPVQLVDQDLYKQSLQLFRHERSLDKKPLMDVQAILD